MRVRGAEGRAYPYPSRLCKRARVQDRGLELEEQVVTLKGTWAGEFLGGMSEMNRLSTTCQVGPATQPSAAALRL